MKLIKNSLAVLLLILPAWGQLKVVTTIPDLKDIVEQIGGRNVSVSSIARGTENIHNVVLRPSHLVAITRADVFVQVGLSLEHSFVPGLLQKARNKKIAPGAPGFINCSDGWEPIQVAMFRDRSQAADMHPQGNPHMNLDPRAGKFFADKILSGLVATDPVHEESYQEGHAAYCKQLDEAAKRWAEVAKLVAGHKVCTYHRDFDYLAAATGLIIVDTVEPNPGVPPKPSDLANTVELLRKEGVRVILTARWSNNSNVRFIAEKCEATVFELPTMVQGTKGSETWIAMMNQLHESLASAFAEKDQGQ